MKDLEKEATLLGMGAKQRQVYTQLLDMENKAKQDGKPLNDAEIAALKTQIELNQKLQQVSANQNVGLQAWANSFQDLNTELGKVEQKIAGDLTSAMTKFLEGPKEFLRSGSLKKMAQSMEDSVLKAGVDQSTRSATDFIGLTGGQNADPHGSTILGPIAQMIGLAPKTGPGGSSQGIGYEASMKSAMTSVGGLSALQVLVVGSSGRTAGGSAGSPVPGGSGGGSVAGSGVGSTPSGGAAGTSSASVGGNGGGGSNVGSSGPTVMSHGVPIDPTNYGTASAGTRPGGGTTVIGGSPPSSGYSGAATVMQMSGHPQAASAMSSSMSEAQSVGNLFGSKGLLGSDGELFGKTGLMGSAGPFSSSGLMGSQGPVFGDENFFGGGGWMDNTFGSTSLVGSNGFISNMFSGSGSAASGADYLANMGNGVAAGAPNAAADATALLNGAAEGGYAGQAPGTYASHLSQWVGKSVPHYAEGVQNTSGGIPSILHPNEAVIPLSRGRKIPVDMGGGSGQGGSGPVNVHMNISTPDADSFRASQGQIHASLGNSINRAVRRNGAGN